jgi:hypothetical protein
MMALLPGLYRGLTFLFILSFLVGCDLEEQTTSSEIDCNLSLSHNTAMAGKLTIDYAALSLTQIDIHATQPDGSIQTFTKTIPVEQEKFILTSNNLAEGVTIEAKQGDYDPMEMTMLLKKEEDYHLKYLVAEDSVINKDDGIANIIRIDFADFLLNSKSAFVLSGRIDEQGKDILMYVAINSVNHLNVDATQTEKPGVHLGLENKARLTIDPAVLLTDITTAKLDAADRVVHEGQEIIFIHSNFNSRLHRSIVQQFEDPDNAIKLQVVEVKGN